MADALVGIGADLSALTSSLQQIPRIAGTEADKAIRKVQQMSIRASRGVSKAIRQQARENQRAQQAAERAARRSAAANEQVRQVMLAAERETMTASQRAASALQEELRALDRLAAKGAEVAQVERARAAAVAAGARKIAAARAQELGVSAPSRADTGQMKAFASATAGAAKSSSELARAGQSVAMQIPDVITQLSMGTPVLIVLAQQGLQVVQQNMGLVMKAGKALAGLLSGPVAIAAGVVVAAFSVVANHLDETRHRMAAFEQAVNSTAKALSTSQLKSYAQAQRDIADAVDDANLVLAQELGIVDSLDIAQMRAVESIKEAARATTLEAAAIYAKLQVQRQELMQRLHSGELDRYEEDAAKRRIRQLDEQLPRAKAVIDAIKDDVEARQMQVFETYEQIEAIRLEREAQREAEKAARRGTKAIEEQAAAAEKRTAALAKLGAALQAIEEQQTRAFESALAAAQEPFVDKSEIAVLGRLRDGLVEAANAARLTGEEALQTQAALAQIDARIEQIKASSAAALDPLTRQLEQVGGAAMAAADQMAEEVETAFADLPMARIWGTAIVDTAREAGGKAAAVLSTLTGGALAAVTNPAAMIGPLLDEATKGRRGANQIADAAIEFVDSLAKNIGPFIRAFAERIPDIIVAIAKAVPVIVVELAKAMPLIVKGVFEGIVKGYRALARTIARLVRQAFRDVVSFRDRRRRRVSDTPGPIRVDRETTVAPGDYLVAARSPAGLRAQMGGDTGGALSVTTVLDVRDGPVRLGMAVSTRREVDRLGVGRNSSGRTRVY